MPAGTSSSFGALVNGPRVSSSGVSEPPCQEAGEVGQAAYELGELRLRRGDLSGAGEAFRRVLEAGGEPQPGLALLRLAEGKPSAGLSELERALADVPDDRMERARLLPAFVELAVSAGKTAPRRSKIEWAASSSS